jgi:transmembrane sensor
MLDDRVSLEASEWLVRLRETPGDMQAQRQFARWHDAHPDHARAWSEMQALFAMIGQVPRTAPQVRRRTVAVWAGALALAACLALAVAPGLLLRLRADHITGTAEVAPIALSDGSTLRLGPDSAVRVAYDQGNRTVHLLRGQAWFDVVHDPARPFRVVAGDTTVTDVGTAFDVRMIGSDTIVDVGRGRVAVRGPGAAPREFGAGEWARIDPARPMRTGTQAADLAGTWQSGEMLVRGRTVAEAIEELRPWYAGRIVLANQVVGQANVTGIYRLNDPAEALRGLVEPHGGRVIRISPWLMIVVGA